MRLRLVFTCLLLAACPPGEGTTAGSSTGDTTPDASTTPTSGDTPTTTDAGTTATTGAMPDACVAGGIGPAFSWSTSPPPGVAKCLRISDDSLALDCSDWFHPNVEVVVANTDCAALVCDNGSGDEFTPRAISFGQGDIVNTLVPGQDGGVPGEFGGESYRAAVTEAQTGTCEDGEAGEAVELLAYSIVSSGLL